MKVTHAAFGTGTIVTQDANNVTVDFNGNVKTFVTKFAKLSNEDGSPFGVQFVAEVKKTKKTNAEKNMAFERTLTEEQKRELAFKNNDGTTNHNALNDFKEQREKDQFNSKSF